MARPFDEIAPPPELLRTMFRQTRMAMIVTDPHQEDNPIVFANEAFFELTGYEREEVLGRNCRFLQGPETDPRTVAAIGEAVAAETFATFEVLNYRKDGSSFWNALHVSPFYNDDGSLAYFFGSQWDVTDRREALEALEGRTRLRDQDLQDVIDRTRALELAVNQANDSVLMTEYEPLDEPGPRITWVSRGFEKMTGYTAEEVIGRSPRFLQGEATDREALARLRNSLENGKTQEHTRTVNYRKDGSPFWIEWSVSPIQDDAGKPTGWLAVQRDVSEQVKGEQDRERLLDELDHRVRNIFATMQVITRGADDGDGTADGLRRRLLYQLQALNSAHSIVFQSPDREASMADIVEGVLQPFDPAGDRIARDGEDGSVDGKHAVSAAIILYELASLSAERGALAKETAASVNWDVVDDELRITWTEEAPVPEPGRFGFGLVRTFVKSSRWPKAGIDEEENRFTVRLGLRAV